MDGKESNERIPFIRFHCTEKERFLAQNVGRIKLLFKFTFTFGPLFHYKICKKKTVVIYSCLSVPCVRIFCLLPPKKSNKKRQEVISFSPNIVFQDIKFIKFLNGCSELSLWKYQFLNNH